MQFLDYEQFNESEDVTLNKEVRDEYVLTHLGDSKFKVKGDNIDRYFSVTPYDDSYIENLSTAQDRLYNALENSVPVVIYDPIKYAEDIPYENGNIFAGPFTLKEIPEISTSLTSDQRDLLNKSDREYLEKEFETLPDNVKTESLRILSDRAEHLSVVLTALFYFLSTIDRAKFYKGMDRDQIVEIYDKKIEEVSESIGFKYKGPFSHRDEETPILLESEYGYWHCSWKGKDFQIKALISPSKLNKTSENIVEEFSLDADWKRDIDAQFINFEMTNLEEKIKLFVK